VVRATRRLLEQVVPHTTQLAIQPSERNAYFGPVFEWVRTPVLPSRANLPSVPEWDHGPPRDALAGPLIVEEYDTTVVIPPGWRAWLGRNDCIFIAPDGTEGTT
jgi:N-methylhydantoinase A